MVNLLTCSENMKHEYCCTVVRIGKCWPIDGADRIQKTLVNGMSMVISKNVKEGDIMLYAANETELACEFLQVNNLFNLSYRLMNHNHAEVQKLVDEGQEDEARKLCGFFDLQCRVKLLRLKGIDSFGFLFGKELLENWIPETKNVDWESLVNTDFDTVCGKLFIKAYIPRVKEPPVLRTAHKQYQRKERFDRLIEGNFFLHYESQQLQRCIGRFTPDTKVAISVKIHGTSAIYGRVKCHIPVKLPFYTKLWNILCKVLRKKDMVVEDWRDDYDNIYSSRRIIRNRYCDKKNPVNTTTSDIYGEYNELLRKYIDDDMTVYGEIFGYKTGENGRMIQKDYDYGCQPGTNKFMPYRIVLHDKELEVSQVVRWTEKLVDKHPELIDRIMPMQILFNGKLGDLYPDIAVDETWADTVLERMKTEPRFGMEQNEVLCHNKVPREGVCIRIEKDAIRENFKLKCTKFLRKEAKNIDAGEVDSEMTEA